MGLVPFENYADGLDVLHDAGMSPREVLTAATSGAAAACGLAGVTGRLAPAMDADIVVVPGDPTRDLDVLHTPICTVARGRTHWCPDPVADNRAERRTAARDILAHLNSGADRHA
jgi:imidazolonepropionase-like amidohydrolase